MTPPHVTSPGFGPGPVTPPRVTSPGFGPGPVAPPHVTSPGFGPGPVTPPHVTSPGFGPGPVTPPRVTSPGFGPGPVTPPHVTSPGFGPGPVTPPRVTSPGFGPGPVTPPRVTSPGFGPGPVTPPRVTSPGFGPGPVAPPHVTSPGFGPGPVTPPAGDPPTTDPAGDPPTTDPAGDPPASTLRLKLSSLPFGLPPNEEATASALDQILARSTPTPAQTALIDAAASLPAASVPGFLAALNGQIHSDAVATTPEAGWQLENSVYSRLGEAELQKGPHVWVDVSTEFGQRGSDSTADSFQSNTTQVVAGADLIANGAARLGLGYAHTRSTVSETNGNGNTQENAGFVYGQLPVDGFLVSGIGSYGTVSTDTDRADPLDNSALADNGGRGGDALVSLEASRPFTLWNVTLAPYGRVTWQRVTQDGSTESGASPAALSVARYTGDDVRSIIGVTGGSAVNDPLAALTTWRADFGVGEDAGNLLNPVLNATLAGISTTIAAPKVSSAFAQASVSGTLRLTPSAYAYGQIFGLARGNETLGGVTGGLRINF